MSYDLAVWEGPKPSGDDAAAKVFGALIDQAEEAPTPPTARIRSYVETLIRRYPENQHGPWTTLPVLEGASAGFVYLTLAFGAVEEVVSQAAKLAAQQGLVCFDPQAECLLPGDAREGPAPSWEPEGRSWTEAPVSREEASRVLGIRRPKLDRFADRLGAGSGLDLAELLTVSLLAIDDLHPPERWGEAALELRRWLEGVPDLDEPTMLFVDGATARMLDPGALFRAVSDTRPPIAMYDVPGALVDLLDRLRHH